MALTGVLGSLGFSSAAAIASEPAPSIESESAAPVTSTDATLHAQINTNGLYTAYEFQIDTDGSYDYTQMACPLAVPGYMQCMVIVDGPPLPAGLVEPSQQDIPAGSSGAQSVSVDLASIGATLQPGETYHYRVIASNGGQGAQGPDQTFTTPSGEPPPPAAPSIESESVSAVTETYNEFNPPGHPRIDATLNSQINTEGLQSTYQFQIGTDTSYRLTIGCPGFSVCMWLSEAEGFPLHPASIPGASGSQHLSVTLSDFSAELAPSTTYHYRIVATNSAGTTEGPDQTFTTPPAGSAPSIDSESVSKVTESDATLQAQVDPDGLETTYRFLLLKPCFPAICDAIAVTELPAARLSSSSGDRTVSVDLNSAGVTLQPDTYYEFEVIASNAAGNAVRKTGADFEDSFKTTIPGAPDGTGAGAPVEFKEEQWNIEGAERAAREAPRLEAEREAKKKAEEEQAKPPAPAIAAPPIPAPQVKATTLQPGAQTAAQKLSKALKACAKKPRGNRAACVKQARKHYATTAGKASKRNTTRAAR
ncbi:MAG TPA: hypothetical protein VID48_13735 [Solirubrobacteraceae bacterium]|jgi:hypothetical protein